MKHYKKNKSKSKDIKVSIVTVCKNNEETIEETIKSVINQTYKNREYIVIDINSTDNSLRIIKKYKKYIHKLVIEKNKGIFAAMNNSIRLINGDLVIFMNSNNLFTNCFALERIVNTFKRNNCLLLYSDIILNDSLNKKFLFMPYDNINKYYFYKQNISQQSIVYKKEIFKKYGYFNQKYMINADKDYLMRLLYVNKVPTYHLPIPLIITRLNKANISPKYIDINKKENKIIVNTYFTYYERIIAKIFLHLENTKFIYFFRKVLSSKKR